MLQAPYRIVQQLALPQRLARVPEPEPVMEAEARCSTYAEESHQGDLSGVFDFCADLLASWNLPRARVLDIACGTGELLMTLGQRCPEWELHGVDASQTMLGLCQARAQTQHRPERFVFHHADMRSLDAWPAGQYDLCTFTLSAHHAHSLDEVARVLEAMLRLTREGGGILLFDLGRLRTKALNDWWIRARSVHYDRVLRQEFAESLAAAFTAEELRSLTRRFASQGLRHVAQPMLPVFQLVYRPAQTPAGVDKPKTQPRAPAGRERVRTYWLLRSMFALGGVRRGPSSSRSKPDAGP